MSMKNLNVVTRIAAIAALATLPYVAFAQSLPSEIDNLPAHFMVPVSKWANVPADPKLQKVTHKSYPAVGLRVIAFPRSKRTTSAKELAQMGLVKDGDVLLTFRPEWTNTAAYANIQMGISHSALAYIDNSGMVQTVESPMSYNSHLDSPEHYSSSEDPLKAMHILRPKMTEQERANMKAWLQKLNANGPGRISFDKNYDAPEYFTETLGGNKASVNEASVNSAVAGLINKVAGIAQGKNLSASLYCSEFVYSALGLRKCDPSSFQYSSSSPASCIQPIFRPLPLIGINGQVGLTDGPSTVMRQAKVGTADRQDYVQKEVLVPGVKVNNMSSGHREVMTQFLPLIPTLSQYYASNEVPQMAMGINAQAQEAMGLVPNYSPTSMLIKSVDDDNALEYVGTVYYY